MCMTIEKKSTNDENPKTLITGKCNHIRTFRKSLIDGGFVHNVQMIIGEGVASIVRKNCDKNNNNQRATDVDSPYKKIENAKV